MSLLSVQNLAAPLKNTTHVITLILVAGLFGSYRYAGGKITTTPHDGVTRPAQIQSTIEEIEEDLISSERPAEGQPPLEAEPPKKMLDRMIGRGSKKEDANKENLKTTLDDIEKQLGLR